MSPHIRALRALASLAHITLFPALLACTPVEGKYSEIDKICKIHNQAFSLMPDPHTAGADITAQYTEGAGAAFRKSTNSVGSNSNSALHSLHVQNWALKDQEKAAGGLGSQLRPDDTWPKMVRIRWCMVYLTSRSHGQYYYTVGALDAEAKKYVCLNPERNCILIVSSPAQQKCAQNDLVWDGGEDAEEWCCDKHDNYCQHEGCASEQVEK